MKKYRLHEKAWKNRQAWKLVNENWNLAHQIVELRDGRECVINDHDCSGCLQLDHTFSRNCKILFFDTKNLNYLCQFHHSHKSFNGGNWVDKTVDEITLRRSGEAWWQNAILRSKKPCPEWKTVYHQAEINLKLIDELFKLKER